ncbi:RDD family protein [Halioxenophilus aromaticivorans]|uniref:RDD family protein n=1 Tax=Halioxenophilus aromaticivorans TaxID=1306992 RepID=A0AAV3U6Y6_9ALTE
MDDIYQPPQSDVEQHSAAGYQFAGFWVRLVATLVDTLLMMIVTYPILAAIYGFDYFTGGAAVSGFWDILFSYVLPAVVVIMFWLYKSATPGKMLLGLKVISQKDGQGLSVSQSIGRYFAYYLSTIPLMLGFIWIAIDENKQGFHDKLAKTYVIKAKP